MAMSPLSERGATRTRRPALLAGVVGLAALALACGDEGASPSAPPPATPKPSPQAEAPKTAQTPAAPAAPPSHAELVADGRSTYNANCIACHAMDPTQDGALGPAVAGSSLALVTARVIHGNYPEGYTPKRPSRVMVPLPHLEPKLTALAAYLQSLE